MSTKVNDAITKREAARKPKVAEKPKRRKPVEAESHPGEVEDGG